MQYQGKEVKKKKKIKKWYFIWALLWTGVCGSERSLGTGAVSSVSRALTSIYL